MRTFLVAATAAVLLGACGELPHDSPFDPNTPADKQAKAEVVGEARLAGETDHAGVTVELQGDARTYNVQTAADGSFRIAGVVPGVYAARFETRYFTAVTETITVALGALHRIPSVTLAARTAQVTGSAQLQRQGEDPEGGVTVRLRKTGSVRGGAAPAPGPWRTAAADNVFETDSVVDGSFALDDVPAGVYEVVASSDETGDEAVGEITVTGEDGPVEVEPILVKPVSGFFSIDTAGGFVTTPVVTLRLTAYNAESMRVGLSGDGTADDCAFGDAVPLTAVATATLPYEGAHVVCVAFIDAKGKASAPALEPVFFDATAPAVYELVLADGAAYSRTLSARLDVRAADAGSGLATMQIAFTPNITAATPQAFVPLSVLALPGGDGVKTVYLRLVDAAGNATPVYARTITVDTVLAATVTAVLEDDMGRTAATDRQLVSLRLMGLTADVSEMIAAANNSFAGAAWIPVTDSVAWQLAAGDGPKTAFVKVRDAAGNESAVLQAVITLDQSGPDTPGLSLFDADGDGSVVTNTAVELVWGIPGAADLAGFELQRYVEGVDLGFVTLDVPGPTVDRYEDDVTATVGHAHHYRVRAYDALGNVSGWSVVVDAHPFEPIEEAYWIRAESGLRYVFNPFPGTYSLRAAYQYEAFDGLPQLKELNTDVAYWDRVTAGGVVLNETLFVKTVNRDNTLAFQSEIPLNLETRRRVAAGGRFVALAPAADGTLHLFMNGGVTNASGASYVRLGADGSELANYHYQMSALYLPRAGAIQLRPNGDPVGIAISPDNQGTQWAVYAMRSFTAGTQPEKVADVASPSSFNMGPGFAATASSLHVFWTEGTTLYYANDATGAWQKTVFATGTAPNAARDAAGKVHLCYHAGTTIMYANNVTGGWYSAAVTGASGRYCSIALQADGKPLIAYAGLSGGELYLAAWNGSAWNPQLIFTDPAGGAGYIPGIFVDAAGAVHLGFDPGSNADMRYVTNRTGAWTARAIDTGNATFGRSALAYDANGTLTFLYYYTVGTEARLARFSADQRVIKPVTGLGVPEDFHAAWDGTTLRAWMTEFNGLTYDSFVVTRQPDDSWTKEKVGADPFGNVQIAVDAGGHTHLAWYDSTNFDAMYATNASGTWVTQAVESAGDVGWAARVLLDPSGKPVLAYSGLDDQTLHVARYDGVSWSITTLAGGYAELGDATMDPAGHVHLVASKNSLGDVWYVTDRYGAWTTEQVDSSGYHKSIAAEADGTVHIAYFRWQPNYDLGYATNEGGIWRRTIVDAPGDTGFYPKILLDSRETPHILYRDDSNQRLCYAVRVNGGWSAVRLVPYFYSFDGYVDAADEVHAVYFDPGFTLTEMASFQGRLPARDIQVVTPW